MNLIAKKSLSTFLCASLLCCISQLSWAQTTGVEQVNATQVSQKENLQVINLNKSNVNELLTLKGIGEVKAQAIVTYRKQVGHFTSVEQLTQVKGIGEKVIHENKARLRI